MITAASPFIRSCRQSRAVLRAGVSVGPYAVVAADAELAEGVTVGPFA